MTGLSPFETVREAVHNAAAARVRLAIQIVAWTVMLGGIVIAELTFSQDLLAFNELLDQAGRRVLIVAPTEGGELPASTCAGLGSESWVQNAGGRSPPEFTTLLVSGPLRFQSARITVGLLPVLDPASEVARATLVLGKTAADELGLRPGVPIHMAQRPPISLGGVIDTSVRNEAAGRWIFEVTPPVGSVSECWVEVEPWALDDARGLVEAAFPAISVAARPLIDVNQFTRDPVVELAKRPQRQAWIVIGSVFGFMGLLSGWFRRAESGLYAVLGNGRRHLLVMSQVETLLVAYISIPSSILWSVVWVGWTGGIPSADLLLLGTRTAVLAAAMGAIIAPLGALAIPLKDIAALLKDRG